MREQLLKYSIALLFLATIILIQWIPRSEFWLFASTYIVSFGSFLMLFWRYRNENRFMISIASISAISFLFSSPLLSEDIYRFLWDGRLWTLGLNPYSDTPNEIYLELNDPVIRELYLKMTDLSKGNFTCYPIYNQLYFYVASIFSSTVLGGIMILKGLFLMTLIPAYLSLKRILTENKLGSSLIWFVFINPLFLIESLGNLHFEAIMMSYLIIALYFIKKNWLFSSIFFTLAVQIKLIPLIAIPFLVRFIGIRKTIYYGTIVVVLSILMTYPYMSDTQFNHFMEGLRLYYGTFEFNSFIPHYLQEFISLFTGFNPIQYTAPILSIVSFGVVLYFAFFRSKNTITELAQDISIALLFYFLLNNTVHPWYIIFLLFLFPLSRSRTVLIWTMLITLSYSFYSENGFVSRLLIDLQYILVIASLILEKRNRMKISAYDRVS